MRSRSFSETSKRVIPLTQNVYGLEKSSCISHECRVFLAREIDLFQFIRFLGTGNEFRQVVAGSLLLLPNLVEGVCLALLLFPCSCSSPYQETNAYYRLPVNIKHSHLGLFSNTLFIGTNDYL